jgi:CRP/FNR family transcriptional regulator, cyclic AMP receptor protein
MTTEKRGIFPITLLSADDRSGERGGPPGGRRPPSAPKIDYRKGSLRKIPLLSDLSDDSLERLQSQAARITFAKGQEIIGRTDPSRDVFILLSGQARVTFYSAAGRAVAFRRIDPGDVVGEFAAIDGQGRSATVEAARPCTVLSIGAGLFWDLTDTDRRFAAAMMRHLVALLRALTARVVEFSTLGVKDRIHCELLRMAKKALEQGGTSELNPAPTHSDLAARISTHREAVSRELSRLSKLGVIERRGRIITVKNLAQLERMVQEASGE